jgi:hypothetical protein
MASVLASLHRSTRALAAPVCQVSTEANVSGITQDLTIRGPAGLGVLVVAQALDQLHRGDDGAGWDLVLVAWHGASASGLPQALPGPACSPHPPRHGTARWAVGAGSPAVGTLRRRPSTTDGAEPAGRPQRADWVRSAAAEVSIQGGTSSWPCAWYSRAWMRHSSLSASLASWASTVSWTSYSSTSSRTA